MTADPARLVVQQALNQRARRSSGIGGYALVLCAVAGGGFTSRALDPAKPWGKAVEATCPKCGKHNLRERLSQAEGHRRQGHVVYVGTVTLCSPECGYAALGSQP